MATNKKTAKKATATKKTATKKTTKKQEAVVEIHEEEIVNPAVDEVVENKAENGSEDAKDRIQEHFRDQLSSDEQEVTLDELAEERAEDDIPYEDDGGSRNEDLRYPLLDEKPEDEPKEEEAHEDAPKEEVKEAVKERPMSYERMAARMRRYMFSKQITRR